VKQPSDIGADVRRTTPRRWLRPLETGYDRQGSRPPISALFVNVRFESLAAITLPTCSYRVLGLDRALDHTVHMSVLDSLAISRKISCTKTWSAPFSASIAPHPLRRSRGMPSDHPAAAARATSLAEQGSQSGKCLRSVGLAVGPSNH
jgi:membrane-associated phospholipid phosphatase